MALFNNSKHTYYEEFSTPRDMMNKIKDIFIEQEWILLRYETGDYSDELAVGSPTGEFCIGIKTYIHPSNSVVKGIEFQCFRTFNEERSINNQPMCIPKTNKKSEFVTQPPQSNFVTGGDNKAYIQVTRDHIIGCLIDVNNEARAFYAGKFVTYASKKQYPLPLFVGGSTNGEDRVLVDDTYCEPYDAANRTTSSFMFGRRIIKSVNLTTYLTTDYFLDFEGRWQRCAALTTPIIDDYPNYNANGNPENEYATIFPIASGLTGDIGVFFGEPRIDKIKILSNKNERTDNDSYIAGELSNLILIYDNTVFNEELRTIDGSDYILFNDLFRKNSYNNNFGIKII